MRILPFHCGVVTSFHIAPFHERSYAHTTSYFLPTQVTVSLSARIESAEPTEQRLGLPVLRSLGSRRRGPDGYDIPKVARAADRQCSFSAEPIHRCEHLRPRIGRQPLNKFIECAGHQAGHFVAND